jgi:hypothetical protein
MTSEYSEILNVTKFWRLVWWYATRNYICPWSTFSLPYLNYRSSKTYKFTTNLNKNINFTVARIRFALRRQSGYYIKFSIDRSLNMFRFNLRNRFSHIFSPKRFFSECVSNRTYELIISWILCILFLTRRNDMITFLLYLVFLQFPFVKYSKSIHSRMPCFY